jgi:hypothetical protein
VTGPTVDREVRQDVADVLVRYATGIDRRDWAQEHDEHDGRRQGGDHEDAPAGRVSLPSGAGWRERRERAVLGSILDRCRPPGRGPGRWGWSARTGE